uniref:Replicative DNA helicase n=1 Tax=uncultured marine virus TaxID=186617 RepID=A0A0F7L639_9VIRU|nr:replicative DNA helicase [uncultured marine virus]
MEVAFPPHDGPPSTSKASLECIHVGLRLPLSVWVIQRIPVNAEDERRFLFQGPAKADVTDARVRVFAVARVLVHLCGDEASDPGGLRQLFERVSDLLHMRYRAHVWVALFYLVQVVDAHPLPVVSADASTSAGADLVDRVHPVVRHQDALVEQGEQVVSLDGCIV